MSHLANSYFLAERVIAEGDYRGLSKRGNSEMATSGAGEVESVAHPFEG